MKSYITPPTRECGWRSSTVPPKLARSVLGVRTRLGNAHHPPPSAVRMVDALSFVVVRQECAVQGGAQHEHMGGIWMVVSTSTTADAESEQIRRMRVGTPTATMRLVARVVRASYLTATLAMGCTVGRRALWGTHRQSPRASHRQSRDRRRGRRQTAQP